MNSKCLCKNESEIKAIIQMNSNKKNRESFVYLSIWEITWQLDIGKGASFWSLIPPAMLKIQIGNRLYYQLPCAMPIPWNTKVSGDLKLFRGVLIKSICSVPGECGTFHCTFSSVLAYVLGAFLDTSSVIVGWGGGPLLWAQSIDVQHTQSPKQGAREWPLGVVYKPCLNSSSACKKPPTKQLGDTCLMTLIIYWNRTADSSWRNMLLNNLIVEELPISAISANILSNRHDFLTR